MRIFNKKKGLKKKSRKNIGSKNKSILKRKKMRERSKKKKGGSLGALGTLNKKTGPNTVSPNNFIPGSGFSGPPNTFYSEAKPIYDEKLLDSLKLLLILFIIYSILFNIKKTTPGGSRNLARGLIRGPLVLAPKHPGFQDHFRSGV